MPTQSADWYDTVIAAKARARLNNLGYAFAVQWPDGHCTVEDRKPSLRSRDMRVLDCDCTGCGVSGMSAVARHELHKSGTEHPAVMMERLLQEKHNLILDNERLRQALAGMLRHFGHPKRDEWLNDAAWEQAVIACEHAHFALDRTK